MDEARLLEKLARIEALFAGTSNEGERDAAAAARQRILERLREAEKADPPVEYRFTMADAWARKLFTALLRRYGLQPYRYRGQRHTTLMVRVSRAFVDKTLWPEFEQFSSTLSDHLEEVTDRVIHQILHQQNSEPTEVTPSAELPPGDPK